MAYSLVQEVRNLSFSGSAQPTLTPASNVTKGNLLIAFCASTATTATTIDDGGINTWIQLGGSQFVAGFGTLSAWYAIAAKTAALTVKFYDTTARNIGAGNGGLPSNLSTSGVQLLEFSGNSANPLDATARGSGTSTAPAQAVTATGSADLVWACGIQGSGSVITVGGGWTDPTSGGHPNGSSEYNIEVASGTFTPTFSQAPSATWGVISAAFKALGSTFTISGNLGGAAQSGATVFFVSTSTGMRYSATADASGNYTSPALENDTFVVQPQLVGNIFSPARNTNVVISGSNVTAVNFTPTLINTNLSLNVLASDTFTRANENPLNAAVWSVDGTPVPPFDPGLQIVSNECELTSTAIINTFAGPQAADGIENYIGITWPTDQWAEFQIDSLVSGQWTETLISLHTPVADSSGNYLQIRNNGDGTASIFANTITLASTSVPASVSNARNRGDAYQNIPSPGPACIGQSILTTPFVAGDKFAFASKGSNYYILRNRIVIGNFSDSSLNSGNIAIQISGNALSASQVSNFLGGKTQIVGQPTFIQGNSVTGGSAVTSTPIAFSSNNTAGSLLVIFARIAGSPTGALGVTDTQGNTWVQVTNSPFILGTTNSATVWYALNAKAGANTVTLTNGTAQIVRAAIGEWSGVATSNAVDITSTANNNGSGTSNPSTTNSITTTKINDLVLAFSTQGTLATTNPTIGGGFTLRVNNAGTNDVDIADNVGAAGAYSASFTYAQAVNWATLAIAFFASSSSSVAWVNRERKFVNKR